MRKETDAELKMEEVFEGFQKSKEEAEEIIKDKKKTQDTVNKAMNKAIKVKGPLEKVWNSLILMGPAVLDWTTGKYKKIPVGSIIAIVGALIYFLSPIDVIPDFIPGIGYIDDVFVISLVISQINDDLEKYKIWRENNKTHI